MYRIIFLSPFLFILLACSGKNQEESTIQMGKAIVDANCKVCHAQGINGAPIIGNRKMWEPRMKKTKDELVSNALSGFGLMPAKGGKTELTEGEISLAVTYMLSQIN